MAKTNFSPFLRLDIGPMETVIVLNPVWESQHPAEVVLND